MTRLTSVGLLVSMIHLGCGTGSTAEPYEIGREDDRGTMPMGGATTNPSSTVAMGGQPGGTSGVVMPTTAPNPTAGAPNNSLPTNTLVPSLPSVPSVPSVPIATDTQAPNAPAQAAPAEAVAALGQPSSSDCAPSETLPLPSVPLPSVPLPPPPATIPSDSDHDGVIDIEDLCPATGLGISVTSCGCDSANAIASKVPWGSPIPLSALSAVPLSGSVDPNGFTNLVVDSGARFPIVFRVHTSGLEQRENGYHVRGSALLDVPGDVIVLRHVDLTFEYGHNHSDGLQIVRGRCDLPLPNFAGITNLGSKLPIADLDLERGSMLHDLSAPLLDDRRYLTFHFGSALALALGSLRLDVPPGIEHLLVLDHTDPFFFLRGNCTGIPGLPTQLSDVGLGFSRQGLLSFRPSDTWGLPAVDANNTQGFLGQLFLQTKAGIPIPGTPISLLGPTSQVLDIDPTDCGQTVLTDPLSGLRCGGNQPIGLKIDVIPGITPFELAVGSASLDLSLVKDATSGHISGIIDPGDGKSLFNDLIPVVPQTRLNVAAAVATPSSNSHFALEGDVALKLSTLNSIVNLPLLDVPIADAQLGLDKSGLTVHGDLQASLIGALGVGSNVTLDGLFPGNTCTTDWHLDLNGDLSVHGVRLDGSTCAHLDRNGLRIDGHLRTALATLAMNGHVDQSGATLRGHVNVSIPMLAGLTEVQTVADGTACGFEQVTSAAICGVREVTGFAACGVDYLTHCVLGGCCTEPTCQVAKTCDDPNQPKTCAHDVTIPNFNYGTFQGTVDITVGPSGVEAKLSGACVDGPCTATPTTSVDIASSQACVQLPGIAQTFCTKF